VEVTVEKKRRNRPDAALTRSQAEERLLELVRKADLPPPELSVMVNGCELDFYWRDRAFAVEVDGFVHHASRRSFEGDRRRAACLAAAGIHTIRVTWRQLETEPFAVLARLAHALAPAATNPRGRQN
jgi:very-short-patch-repair endonuclease